MTELGVGYISIVAETSKIGPGITRALDSSQVSADRAGQGIGSKLASGIGKTLKVGAVGAGAAAGGVLATAITKGIGRLSGIENAQAKLTGLGNSASSVDKIMENALASVKGTAFGLEDAATVAASAVAANIKPGQDLERTLKLTGDAATIAGVGMGEMGAIFNKVAASNKIQGDVIAQLNDKGIPIIQLLGTELGKTAEETLKLASDGEINFATFQNAMEKGLGGAALKSGETVKGSLANMGAALGRFGATLAAPGFTRAAGVFGSITAAIDGMNDRAKPVLASFERSLTNDYIPALMEFGETVRDGFNEFRNSDLVVSSMGTIGSIFESLMSTAMSLAPSLQDIGTSLATASAATGVSTWQVLLSVLESIAPILDATLVPALQTVSTLMTQNQSAANLLSIGFLAFKTIPGLISPIATRLSGLATSTSGAATQIRNVTSATGGIAQVAGYGATNLGRFGSAVQNIGTHAPVIGAMQGSFLNAAGSAQRFGRFAGVSAAAITGLSSGVRGLASLLGGPLQLGIAAAVAAFVVIAREAGKAGKQQDELALAGRRVSTASREMAAALTESMGVVDAGVIDSATNSMQELEDAQLRIAETGPGMIAPITQSWESLKSFTDNWDWSVFKDGDVIDRQRAVADEAELLKGQFETLGLSSEELGAKVTGTSFAWENFQTSLRARGLDELADELAGSRSEFELLQGSMERVTPAGATVSAALEEISNAAGDSDTKLNSLRRALQALGILETDAQAALFETAEAVRDIADAAAEGIDRSQGFGDSLFKDGVLDGAVKNASTLRGSIKDLGDQYLALRTSGVDSTEALAAVAPGLQTLADQYGVPLVKIEELAEAIGGIADKPVGIALAVEGRDEASQAIADVALRLAELPDGEPKTINMVVEDIQAQQALRDLGFTVSQVIGGAPGEITVTANNELAISALAAVSLRLGELDADVATPDIDADATSFILEDQATKDALANLDRSSASPEINALIDDFINGRDITMAELARIDTTDASPEVKLAIDQALERARIINAAIDQAARDRQTKIEFAITEYRSRQQAYNASGMQGPVPIALPENASGGRLPVTGPGTDRTDGILGVARASGAPTTWVDKGEWIINGRSSAKYDRELAMINAGTFPKHEAGGKVGAKDLLDFVNGSQSQPLTGAKYDWGGVKWGDCSGAMSAIARFAVGLPAFAARFATATMGSALSSMGFSSGLGGIDDLNFGWLNGGPGGGHTAGTLPGGTNVEMGGGYGGGMVGGSVGASASQFTDHAHLPIGAGVGYAGGTRVTRKDAPVWSEKQQLDLDAAAIGITTAEEARNKVEAEFIDGKKSQADLDAANVKVQQAQQKVTDLQAKKDEVAAYVEEGPAPQAPALSKTFTESESARIDAQLAAETANTRRNEVYDNPESTPLELAKADTELYAAQEALKTAGTEAASKSGSASGVSSWSDLFGNFAKDFVSGQVEDALGVFGIPNDMPGIVKAGMMLGEAFNETPTDPGNASKSDIMADSPVLYDPSKGPEQWRPVAEEGLARAGESLASTAQVLDRIAQKSGGDPSNLLGLARDEFAANRDPSLPNDPMNPLANLFADLRRKPIKGYHSGGTVVGPAGRDKVPAWLEAKEYVVNAAAANSGVNPQILQAMNSGAKLAFGGSGGGLTVADVEKMIAARPSATFVVNDMDAALRKWQAEQKSSTGTYSRRG